MARLVVHLLAQQPRQLGQRLGDALQRPRQIRAPRCEQLLAQGMRFGFQRIEGIAVVAAGAHMADRQLGQKDLRPVRAARRRRCRAIQPSPASAPAACTASSSAARALLRRRRSDPSAVLPARACGVRARPSGPRIQRRSSAISRPDSKRGKTAIGGVEQMMAFVEDIAQRAARGGRVGGLVRRQPVAARPARSPARDWRPRWARGARGGWRAR